MTMTTTARPNAGTSTSTLSDPSNQKGWADFLGGILPDVARTIAPTFGIDPRVAGQTVSQVLSIFGLGSGKAFTSTLPREEAVAQLQQLVGPHLNDPLFAKALGKWMQDAVAPVQAQKEGKAYQPSVDMSKNWFDDAISWIGGAAEDVGNAVASVNWGQVAQVGMQALPIVLSLL